MELEGSEYKVGDDICSHFNTSPACNRQTDGQKAIIRVSLLSRIQNWAQLHCAGDAVYLYNFLL